MLIIFIHQYVSSCSHFSTWWLFWKPNLQWELLHNKSFWKLHIVSVSLSTMPWTPALIHLKSHPEDLKTEWENESPLGLGLWTITCPQQLWTGPSRYSGLLLSVYGQTSLPVSRCFRLVINTGSTWQRVHVATAIQPNLAPVFNPWGFKWIS